MIKARELRIGNLVLYSGRVTTLQSVGPAWCHATEELDEVPIDTFKPIDLTIPWLEVFGFRWSEALKLYVLDKSYPTCEPDDYNDAVYHRVRFDRNQDSIGIDVSNEHGESASLSFGKIKYVHQFQNLFFALTGEEITAQTTGNERKPGCRLSD